MRGSPLAGVLALGAPFLVGAALLGEAPAEIRESFRFTDPEITESSGLVAQDGLVLTVNDSGDTGRVFAVDPASGDTVGVTRFADTAVDVEALAPAGPGQVWVADIGDNRAVRDQVTVTRVRVGRGDRDDPGATSTLAYPDEPHDAETLLAHPRTGRLFVVTKGLFGGEVYAAPRHLDTVSPNLLRARGSVLGLATDGAFFPDGRHLVLRSYDRAVVYAWPSLEQVGEVPLPRQEQGEGLALTRENRLLLSSEGVEQPVLILPLPASLLALVAPEPGETAEQPSPTAEPLTAPPADASTEPEGEVADGAVWPYVTGIGGLVVLLVGGVMVRRWRHGTGRRPG